MQRIRGAVEWFTNAMSKRGEAEEVDILWKYKLDSVSSTYSTGTGLAIICIDTIPGGVLVDFMTTYCKIRIWHTGIMLC